jgi:hypothetical protein
MKKREGKWEGRKRRRRRRTLSYFWSHRPYISKRLLKKKRHTQTHTFKHTVQHTVHIGQRREGVSLKLVGIESLRFLRMTPLTTP